ncbi:MAG: tetratricopeptide repeat protein [Candidatus Competibacteraceae bacterium]|nr:tetratricopeptide repeat protein [Candidatus Competibacteraceae bacterium]
MKKQLFIFVFFFYYSTTFATIQLRPANEAYSKGQFDEALALYQQLANEGQVSWVLYYNLANAAFKTGNYALAVLNYERAARLNPTHPDIRYNLSLVRNQLPDKQTVLTYTGVTGFLFYLRNLLTIDQWAWLSIMFLFMSFVSFLLTYLLHSFTLKKILFVLVPFWFFPAISSALLAQWYYVDFYKNEAIVMNTEVPVFSSPDKSVVLFVLHYGTKINIQKEKNEWLNISFEDKSGWIEATHLARISVP